MHRLLPLLTVLLFLPFPSAGGEVDSGGRTDREVLEVLKGEDYYTRAAFGDVYPLHPGGEAVVVGRDQKVSILYGSWPYFERLVAFEDKWFLMTVAVGDLLPEYPGEEIVVGGWSEVVTLIWWDGGFHHKSLYNYRDWIYDIEIGDVDPRYPGEEILVVGETGEATLLHRTNGMNFSAEVVHKDPYL
ncbi:MAG: hypothetical protein J7L88_03700, partial [Thermoplasmata archaeon]|nr:hypothetical protein [Thermoplasmata archaeon]